MSWCKKQPHVQQNTAMLQFIFQTSFFTFSTEMISMRELYDMHIWCQTSKSKYVLLEIVQLLIRALHNQVFALGLHGSVFFGAYIQVSHFTELLCIKQWSSFYLQYIDMLVYVLLVFYLRRFQVIIDLSLFFRYKIFCLTSRLRNCSRSMYVKFVEKM